MALSKLQSLHSFAASGTPAGCLYSGVLPGGLGSAALVPPPLHPLGSLCPSYNSKCDLSCKCSIGSHKGRLQSNLQRRPCAAAGYANVDTALLPHTIPRESSLGALQTALADAGEAAFNVDNQGPGADRGTMKEAWDRKRTLRKCLQEAGLPPEPTEKLLASVRKVGDHAGARLDFWHNEGPREGAGGAVELEGHPWVLKCDYHEMLAVRGCLLAHGVSLRRNAKLLKYALKHGPQNVERLLLLLEDVGVPDLTRVVHAYPRLLALRSEDVAAKLAFLRDLGLDNAQLAHLFHWKPQFIYPSLTTMQSKVAFLSGAGFTQAQAAALISRYPLALGSDLSSHFPRIFHLFQEFGFSHADFLYVVERFPAVLVCRVDDNLRPKLAYFVARGLSPPQLVDMVKAYPCLLGKNLRSALQPKVEYLVGVMERDVCELVAYAAVLGYSMARLRRRHAAVAQYGITCSLSTMLSRTDAQFAAYVARVSRQTFEAKMAGVRRVHQASAAAPRRPCALDLVEMADWELPVYKMHSGDGQLKWPSR